MNIHQFLRTTASCFVAALLVATSADAQSIRDDLLAIGDGLQVLAPGEAPERLSESLSQISDDELELVYGPVRGRLQLLRRLVASSVTQEEARKAARSKEPSTTAAASNGWPEISQYESTVCGSAAGYPKTDAQVLAAHHVLEVAQGVWNPLNRGCAETVVGENTEAACIPFDVILLAA